MLGTLLRTMPLLNNVNLPRAPRNQCLDCFHFPRNAEAPAALTTHLPETHVCKMKSGNLSLAVSAQSPCLLVPEATLGQLAPGRPGRGHCSDIFLFLFTADEVEYFFTAEISNSPHTGSPSLFYFRITETQHMFQVLRHDVALDLSSALQA